LYAKRNDALDLAARIVELLDDSAARAEMGEYGRRRVESELEWRHEAPKLLAAYKALWSAVRVPASSRQVEVR
jgi:glycosyltransferase involved in cell wall biosynthesis